VAPYLWRRICGAVFVAPYLWQLWRDTRYGDYPPTLSGQTIQTIQMNQRRAVWLFPS